MRRDGAAGHHMTGRFERVPSRTTLCTHSQLYGHSPRKRSEHVTKFRFNRMPKFRSDNTTRSKNEQSQGQSLIWLQYGVAMKSFAQNIVGILVWVATQPECVR
jgi:hypothetical protein